jgi:hypothetical protein
MGYKVNVVPRIPDDIGECAVFLYPSVDAARNGEHVGGSGFLVGMQSSVEKDVYYSYVVTASHVVKEGKSTVIRINKAEGGFEVLPAEQQHWYHHPYGDDVAVCPVNLHDQGFQYKMLATKLFLTKDLIETVKFGLGDDVFMVGRFVTHEGVQQNMPTVRFGTVAMMPGEPIIHETRGIKQETYLVELHSIPGYSGSPVFVMFFKGTTRYGFDGFATGDFGPYLVGIDWCHLGRYEPVVSSSELAKRVDDHVVRSNLGMAGVVPSWKIQELLDIDDLREQREAIDEVILERRREGASTLDVAPAEAVEPQSAV